jgi:hypothetical protein
MGRRFGRTHGERGLDCICDHGVQRRSGGDARRSGKVQEEDVVLLMEGARGIDA